MQPQLYRNVEHPGLGLLQVVEATPIEGDIGRFLPSNFRMTIPSLDIPPEIRYCALVQKRSGLYDVLVQNERGLTFTMKNAFWDSFVPVSQEENTLVGKLQSPQCVLGNLQKFTEYSALVDRAVPASTKEYCGLLRKVFQKEGILKAVRFDVDVTMERLANFYIFR